MELHRATISSQHCPPGTYCAGAGALKIAALASTTDAASALVFPNMSFLAIVILPRLPIPPLDSLERSARRRDVIPDPGTERPALASPSRGEGEA